MSKKLAVVVRDRQSEALRMSIGLTLMDDAVDIFVLDNKLERSGHTELNLDTIQEMDINIYSNVQQEDNVALLTISDLAKKLLSYDHVLAY